MKKAVGAVLFHCTNIPDEEAWHRFCPSTAESWCKWQTDKLNGTHEYKQKVNLPIAVKDILYPIFKDLSSDDLLSKRLHGLTQNANESINNMIWKKRPKNIFVGRRVLEIAAYSAAIECNDGKTGICKVADSLDLGSGKFMVSSCSKSDKERIRAMEKKCAESAKKRRKKLRSVRKGYQDKEKDEKGGSSYAPGGF